MQMIEMLEKNSLVFKKINLQTIPKYLLPPIYIFNFKSLTLLPPMDFRFIKYLTGKN